MAKHSWERTLREALEETAADLGDDLSGAVGDFEDDELDKDFDGWEYEGKGLMIWTKRMVYFLDEDQEGYTNLLSAERNPSATSRPFPENKG